MPFEAHPTIYLLTSILLLYGIDFDIENGVPLYAVRARRLSIYSQPGRKVYLSAAPRCPFPDQKLDGALKTGLSDYVWIRFYNNPGCDYDPWNPGNFKNWWYPWTKLDPGKILFSLDFRFPGAAAAAGNGYVPKQVLTSHVLPFAKQSAKYGGIMLWDRFNDIPSGY